MTDRRAASLRVLEQIAVAPSPHIDGFYVAYISGTAGLGMGMFIFSNGVVVGSDISGVSYDGTYVASEDGKSAHVTALVKVPGGTTLIQGVVVPPEGESFQLDRIIPILSDAPFFPLDTPHGPVNVRLTKLRDLKGSAGV
jgi:hypothetical protein